MAGEVLGVDGRGVPTAGKQAVMMMLLLASLQAAIRRELSPRVE